MKKTIKPLSANIIGQWQRNHTKQLKTNMVWISIKIYDWGQKKAKRVRNRSQFKDLTNR